MRAKEITNEEIRTAGVASLPTRPNAPAAFGGKGYTAGELKAAFDRLPCLIIERLNTLLSDIKSEGNDSLSGAIPTGISAGHTLADLFADITDGGLASYLSVGDVPLDERLAAMEERLDIIEGRLSDG